MHFTSGWLDWPRLGEKWSWGCYLKLQDELSHEGESNAPRMKLGRRGSQRRRWDRQKLRQGGVLRSRTWEDVAVCAVAERSHETRQM